MGTQEEIRSFVIDNFLFGDGRGLDNDSSFLDGGILDSTGILHLVAFIEEAFSVRVADEELVPENLDSINRVSAYLQRKAASPG